jgi:hypothetical protein
MKKLMMLLFSSVLVFSLAMPVFGQDTGSQEPTKTEKPKKEKKAKTPKAKKEKKSKEKATTPPPAQ